MQKTLGRLITYLLRGMLVLAPVVFTLYIVFSLFGSIDTFLNDVIQTVTGYRFPGLGIIVGIMLITLIGFLSSLFLLQPLFSFFEGLLTHTPLIKVIYSSIKDMLNAFVGNNKKFNQPVLVNFAGNPRFQKLGYVTEKDLTHLGMPGKVAVYLPHSYNISGNLFIVPAEDVTYLDAPAADVMKFIVSGGVTQMEKD